MGLLEKDSINEVWNDITTDMVLADEFASAGIVVSDKEYQEMLFGDIDSGYMSRAFYSNGDNKKTWVDNFTQMLASQEVSKLPSIQRSYCF